MPVRRSVSAARSAPRPRARSRGRTWSRHIGRISRGGPGSATITRPSGRSTHQPGAVPLGLGSARRARDEPGLLAVGLDEGQARAARTARAASARWSGSTAAARRIRAAIASRVRSSGVGPEAAGRDDQVGAPERVAKRAGDDLEPVGQGRHARDLDARARSARARGRRSWCRASRRPAARRRPPAAPRSRWSWPGIRSRHTSRCGRPRSRTVRPTRRGRSLPTCPASLDGPHRHGSQPRIVAALRATSARPDRRWPSRLALSPREC